MRGSSPPMTPRESRVSRNSSQQPSVIAQNFWTGAETACTANFFARPKENRGRAGRQGSNWTRGPRRLATSRLVEVLVCSPAALVRAKRQSVPQVRQTQGVPRAVFIGLLPSRPRWSLLIRVCPLGLHRDMSTERNPDRAGPLLTEAGQTTVASGIPGAQQARWGSLAAWTAGPLHRISDARS